MKLNNLTVEISLVEVLKIMEVNFRPNLKKYRIIIDSGVKSVLMKESVLGVIKIAIIMTLF